LIVLKLDAHDKLGEPARWVMYVVHFDAVHFDKSSYRAMDKDRVANFHLASSLIDEVQIGSVDSVSKLWEDIFTTFPVDSRPIRFEYIV
jgi:hypothetical protein